MTAQLSKWHIVRQTYGRNGSYHFRRHRFSQPPERITKTATAQDILIAINAWAKTQPEGRIDQQKPWRPSEIDQRLVTEPAKLWAVLGALRGPDSNYVDLKDKTTCVIRCALEAFALRTYYPMNRLPEEKVRAAAGMSDSEHFREHVLDAVTAINLMPKIKKLVFGEPS